MGLPGAPSGNCWLTDFGTDREQLAQVSDERLSSALFARLANFPSPPPRYDSGCMRPVALIGLPGGVRKGEESSDEVKDAPLLPLQPVTTPTAAFCVAASMSDTS